MVLSKKFWYSIPIGFIGSLLFIIGLVCGLKYKDKSTKYSPIVYGGLIGSGIQGLLIYGIVTGNMYICFTIVALAIVTLLVSGIIYMITD